MSQEPLRAEYFVTRKDGTMVPLVAVDELPHHIIIEGVSRIMSPFDIAGMTCVGRSSLRHRNYIVETAPELAASNKTSGHDALKAKYFITRDSGNMVPLVALDEMPDYFTIKSVPRAVSVFDIAGMTCVGLGEARDLVHIVEDVNSAPMSYFAERSAARKASEETVSPLSTPAAEPVNLSLTIPQNTAGDLLAPSVPKTITQPNIATPTTTSVAGYITHTPPPQISIPNIEQFDLLSDDGPGFTTTPPPRSPSTILSSRKIAPGVKEYCSYWLRHGECDYQQQGCLYRHEMPLDQETLTKLGLRDIPRWYREKHALGSYLAAGGAGAAFSDDSLKSAAANGIHDDKSSRMSSNWRSGNRGGFFTPNSTSRRPSNIYSPRASRYSMDPSSFTRLGPGTPLGLPFDARARSSNGVQQHLTHQALKNIEKNTAPHRVSQPLTAKQPVLIDDTDATISEAASEAAPIARRRSASTIMSDIEALLGREDSARRAKEDEIYAKQCAEHNARLTESAKPQLAAPKNHSTNGINNGGGRGGGGNRRKHRGGARKVPVPVKLPEKPAADN